MVKTFLINRKYTVLAILLVFLFSGWLLTSPQTKPTDNTLFVYGTLKYPIVRNLVCLCRSETKDVTLNDYAKEGLNIVPQSGSDVEGKIIYVSDRELARIDKYENVPDKYLRDKIIIDDVEHFVYLLNE